MNSNLARTSLVALPSIFGMHNFKYVIIKRIFYKRAQKDYTLKFGFEQ